MDWEAEAEAAADAVLDLWAGVEEDRPSDELLFTFMAHESTPDVWPVFRVILERAGADEPRYLTIRDYWTEAGLGVVPLVLADIPRSPALAEFVVLATEVALQENAPWLARIVSDELAIAIGFDGLSRRETAGRVARSAPCDVVDTRLVDASDVAALGDAEDAWCAYQRSRANYESDDFPPVVRDRLRTRLRWAVGMGSAPALRLARTLDDEEALSWQALSREQIIALVESDAPAATLGPFDPLSRMLTVAGPRVIDELAAHFRWRSAAGSWMWDTAEAMLNQPSYEPPCEPLTMMVRALLRR